MMAFRIGGQVVCIDDSPPKDSTVYWKRMGWRLRMLGDLDGLKRGTTYTVRGIDVDWADERPVLYLEEIVRTQLKGEPQETGFDARRFRPVTERKQSTETGMNILRPLLTPTKESVP